LWETARDCRRRERVRENDHRKSCRERERDKERFQENNDHNNKKKRDLRAEAWSRSRRRVAGRWCTADWERDARWPVGVCGESVGRESVIV